jgi:acetyl-CoA carboxylase biotin carboxyl carrier protein
MDLNSLTQDDVADILALLDSLPYDELDLETPRFRLTLRRTPGGWTQAAEVRSAPTALTPASRDADEVSGTGKAAADGGSAQAETASMEHRCRPSSIDAPSMSFERVPGEAGGEAGAREADGELVPVRAPLPGTFYRAPRPGAAPFVEVGSRVDADTVIGIVETMKLMNSVPAGVAGTVAEFCVANAEFAAHGATLLRIRADR